jgi:biotin carboxyl carrier protein
MSPPQHGQHGDLAKRQRPGCLMTTAEENSSAVAVQPSAFTRLASRAASASSAGGEGEGNWLSHGPGARDFVDFTQAAPSCIIDEVQPQQRTIREVHVKEGDRVKRGQPLLRKFVIESWPGA